MVRVRLYVLQLVDIFIFTMAKNCLFRWIRWSATHWSTCPKNNFISYFWFTCFAKGNRHRLNACGSKMLSFYSLMNKTTVLLPFRLNILRSTFWYTKKKCGTQRTTAEKTAVNKIIQFFSISKKEKWIWFFFFPVGLVRFCVHCNRIVPRLNTINNSYCGTIEGNIIIIVICIPANTMEEIIHWYSCMQLDKMKSQWWYQMKSLNFDWKFQLFSSFSSCVVRPRKNEINSQKMLFYFQVDGCSVRLIYVMKHSICMVWNLWPKENRKSNGNRFDFFIHSKINDRLTFISRVHLILLLLLFSVRWPYSETGKISKNKLKTVW